MLKNINILDQRLRMNQPLVNVVVNLWLLVMADEDFFNLESECSLIVNNAIYSSEFRNTARSSREV